MKRISTKKEFLRDSLWFVCILFLLYCIYFAIEYWPNIVEGFNRGWNGN